MRLGAGDDAHGNRQALFCDHAISSVEVSAGRGRGAAICLARAGGGALAQVANLLCRRLAVSSALENRSTGG
jgi:hypothetical protein